MGGGIDWNSTLELISAMGKVNSRVEFHPPIPGRGGDPQTVDPYTAALLRSRGSRDLCQIREAIQLCSGPAGLPVGTLWETESGESTKSRACSGPGAQLY